MADHEEASMLMPTNIAHPTDDEEDASKYQVVNAVNTEQKPPENTEVIVEQQIPAEHFQVERIRMQQTNEGVTSIEVPKVGQSDVPNGVQVENEHIAETTDSTMVQPPDTDPSKPLSNVDMHQSNVDHQGGELPPSAESPGMPMDTSASALAAANAAAAIAAATGKAATNPLAAAIAATAAAQRTVYRCSNCPSEFFSKSGFYRHTKKCGRPANAGKNVSVYYMMCFLLNACN